jgi:hypothetical protein
MLFVVEQLEVDRLRRWAKVVSWAAVVVFLSAGGPIAREIP